MRGERIRFVVSVPHSSLYASIFCAALLASISSCGAGIPVRHDAQRDDRAVEKTPYSIVCIIHGDGDYLYHDTSGNAHRADEMALVGMMKVAEENHEAEVFIFHQKQREHTLFVFPRHDGEFYYYRNGLLLAHELYWRDEGRSRLDPEVALYRRFHPIGLRDSASVFLYCGHEIPETGGAGYDASYPDRPFTIHDLADGMKNLTRTSGRFDLLLLSTCYGGTPYTVGALAPFARTIIASPENLHLSYFDLLALKGLDRVSANGGLAAFARRFARQSFDRLTGTVQTAVSVVVYDADRVQSFIQSVDTIYDRTVNAVKERPEASMNTFEHCDCADIPPYVLPAMSDGVEVFYQAARFGRLKNKPYHSGWECWRSIDRAVYQTTIEKRMP
jgi:hypothetical protein